MLLSELQLRILAALPQQSPGLRLKHVHDKVGMWAKATINNELIKLRRLDLVTFDFERGDRFYRYRLKS